MAKVLTAVATKNHRPSKRTRREVPDGGCAGLYLVVQTSGHKSWALRFRRPNGRTAKLTLGPVDLSGKEAADDPVVGTPLTLVSARRLAAEVHRQRARGRDVVADHDASKRRQRFEHATRAASMFSAAARDFVEQHAMKKTRRWQNTARLLGLDPNIDLEIINAGLCDRWADRAAAAIDGDDIHALIDETKRLGVPGRKRRSDKPTEGLARTMLTTMSAMFTWLVQRRRVEKNPCAGVQGPSKAEPRDRVLSAAEIVKFWRATDSVLPPYGAALKLLLLTGCRREECAGMRRQSELSDDLSTWTIPGARTKNGKPHVVPLPPLARKIIAAIPAAGDLVFTTNGSVPISGWGRVKRRLDKAMKVPAWVIHDLRRSFVTGLAELGVQPHVIELCVNHTSGARGGVAGVYNRSELMPERKAALERWAEHVAGLAAGRTAKVVPMRAAG
jgi:integrase